MVDIELFKKILSEDDYGFIVPGDYLDKNVLALFSRYSKDAVNRLFKPLKQNENSSYKIETKCPVCGKITMVYKTKDQILRYIKSPNALKYYCRSCKSKAKIQKKNEKFYTQMELTTRQYITTFLNPYKSWNKDTTISRKISVLKYMNVNHDEVKKYILSMNYSDFLQTPYWTAISEHIRICAQYKCQECGSKENLNIHHKTYENHGDEIHHLEDLVCLCQKCHEKHHAK